MKIKILSDLHVDHNVRYLESYLETFGEGDFDTVILAGDTAEGSFGLDWAEKVFGKKNIIYVPGNHEYYNQDKVDLDVSYDFDPIVYNNMSYYDEKEGVRFICSTLWTDFELFGSPDTSRVAAARCINDFRMIGSFDTLKCIEAYHESYSYIEKELQEEYDGTTILVTHFGVAHNSIHMKYLGSELNPYFHTDITELFKKYKVDYCIHGHTHSSCDYMLYGTRVICNPLGYYSPYYGPENKEFIPELILEI